MKFQPNEEGYFEPTPELFKLIGSKVFIDNAGDTKVALVDRVSITEAGAGVYFGGSYCCRYCVIFTERLECVERIRTRAKAAEKINDLILKAETLSEGFNIYSFRDCYLGKGDYQ